MNRNLEILSQKHPYSSVFYTCSKEVQRTNINTSCLFIDDYGKSYIFPNLINENKQFMIKRQSAQRISLPRC